MVAAPRRTSHSQTDPGGAGVRGEAAVLFCLEKPGADIRRDTQASLEAAVGQTQTLEVQVCEAKQQYSSALRNLERISDEIHKHRSRRQSARNAIEIDRASTITDLASDTSNGVLEELCSQSTDASVREWLRRAAAERPGQDDTWTEIDLDYSSPEEVSFEKCSLRPRSSPDQPSPPSPGDSKVSAASPRRIIRSSMDRTALLRADLEKAEKGRRQSLDAILHDTGEKVKEIKEMFQGLSLFGERGSHSAPRTPRRTSPSRARSSRSSADGNSDTDSLASMDMLTDEQIASLMLDKQLQDVCERLAGVATRQPRSPQSPEARF
ncbi:uncharacterized protein LOC134658136 [Cydia amplana]|uniref:uncharacterized protein LOC134658136 n=1 Tax=Cydia amplana TaxID=1869771 RepID=UPI002FE64860